MFNIFKTNGFLFLLHWLFKSFFKKRCWEFNVLKYSDYIINFYLKGIISFLTSFLLNIANHKDFCIQYIFIFLASVLSIYQILTVINFSKFWLFNFTCGISRHFSKDNLSRSFISWKFFAELVNFFLCAISIRI